MADESGYGFLYAVPRAVASGGGTGTSDPGDVLLRLALTPTIASAAVEAAPPPLLFCEYCAKPIVVGQHYLQVVVSIDTVEFEVLLPNEPMNAFAFDKPLCLLQWSVTAFPEYLLGNQRVQDVFRRP